MKRIRNHAPCLAEVQRGQAQDAAWVVFCRAFMLAVVDFTTLWVEGVLGANAFIERHTEKRH
eukprot:1483484-Ditylum_brightwellii.AAC.1